MSRSACQFFTRGRTAGPRDGDRARNPVPGPIGVPLADGFVENFSFGSRAGNRNWLDVDLLERGGGRNTIGARIFVKTRTGVQVREVIAGSSFLSQEPYRKHFGLGPHAPDWICVRWFDGAYAVLVAPPANAIVRLERDALPDSTGDLNGNGRVDHTDLQVSEFWPLRPKAVAAALGPWPFEVLADVNGDNEIDGLDYALLAELAEPQAGSSRRR